MQANLEFQTDRLLLRALKRVDVQPLQRAISLSADSISPWLDWCSEGFDELDAEAWINRSRQGWLTGSSYELAVFEQESGNLVGCVYVSSIDSVANLANLGYWIATGISRTRLRLRSRRSHCKPRLQPFTAYPLRTGDGP